MYIVDASEIERAHSLQTWMKREVVEAVQVSAIFVEDHQKVREYDQNKRLRHYGFDMSLGEIGCFLAHRECWKKAVEGNEMLLVLEGDAMPSPDAQLSINRILEVVREYQDSFDLVRLQGTFPQNHLCHRVIADLVKGYKLIQSYRDPMGAVAYIVTPHAAGRLLRESTSFFCPVDVFLGAVWRHKLRYRTVFPFPFEVLPATSTIGVRSRPRQSVVTRMGIELARSIDDMKRLAYLPYNYVRR